MSEEHPHFDTLVDLYEQSTTQFESRELFGTRKDGRWGYIDRQGRWVIAPQFARAERFYDGRAQVDVSLGKTPKWRRINRKGQEV